jgi:hypothetical protein
MIFALSIYVTLEFSPKSELPFQLRFGFFIGERRGKSGTDNFAEFRSIIHRIFIGDSCDTSF